MTDFASSMVQGMLKKMMEELIRDIMKSLMREMFPKQPAGNATAAFPKPGVPCTAARP